MLVSEYESQVWANDYVYPNGRPIAWLYAVTDTIAQVGIAPDTGGGGGGTNSVTTMGSLPGGDLRISTDFTIHWYHNDHLGTPQATTNKYRTQSWSANDYLPFGKLQSETIAGVENNLRFPGQYHDRVTDLHYNMFRHYRPDLGLYLTPDPIGVSGGLNMYSYAGQNPINRVDPYALYSWGELVHDAANFVVGFGDFVSLGYTKRIRAAYPVEGDRHIGYHSGSYVAGQVTGIVPLAYFGIRGLQVVGPYVGAAAGTGSTWLASQGTRCVEAVSTTMSRWYQLYFASGTHSVYYGYDLAGAVRYVGMTG